jgi:hypothetical protein
MAIREFVLRTNIKYGHEVVLEAANKLLAAHRLKGIALMEVPLDDLTYVGEVALGDTAQRARQIGPSGGRSQRSLRRSGAC